MSRAAVGRRRLLEVVWVLALHALFLAGCAGRVGEAEAAKARATVERALRATTFDDFLAPFTPANRARMKEAPVWIRWWQEKFAKNRTGWQVAEIRGLRDGRIEVIVQHRQRKTSRQFYRLRAERGTWLIDQIESER